MREIRVKYVYLIITHQYLIFPNFHEKLQKIFVTSAEKSPYCVQMKTNLVLTILGADRTGLVHAVAEKITQNGGNWLDSRLIRLAGQFAGVVQIECEKAQIEGISASLKELETQGIFINFQESNIANLPITAEVHFEIVGNDRPGIVHEITQAITAVGANVEQLDTMIESAPMSGYALFRAIGSASLPNGSSTEMLEQAIENLSDDLTVETIYTV